MKRPQTACFARTTQTPRWIMQGSCKDPVTPKQVDLCVGDDRFSSAMGSKTVHDCPDPTCFCVHSPTILWHYEGGSQPPPRIMNPFVAISPRDYQVSFLFFFQDSDPKGGIEAFLRFVARVNLPYFLSKMNPSTACNQSQEWCSVVIARPRRIQRLWRPSVGSCHEWCGEER